MNLFGTDIGECQVRKNSTDDDEGPLDSTITYIDEVWMVPCGRRPDKKHISKPELRLEMVKMAVKDFFPSDFPIKIMETEIDNGDSIPTAFLFDRYYKEFPQNEFYFVMGTDLISGLHWWDDG